MTTTITTLASIPAILALVNLAKTLGLKGKAATILAVLLGLGLNLAQYFLASYGWYQQAIQGVILGLSAAGLYDLTPTFSKPVQGAEDIAEIENNTIPNTVPTIADNIAEIETTTLERVPKHLAV